LYSDAVHLEAAPVRVCLVGALATRPVFAGNLQALTFPRSAGASNPECGKHNIKGKISDVVLITRVSFGLFARCCAGWLGSETVPEGAARIACAFAEM
jgi:hypothetical protein